MEPYGIFTPSRVPEFGDRNFSPALFLVTNVTIFSRSFFSHFSELGHLATMRLDPGPFLCELDAMTLSA